MLYESIFLKRRTDRDWNPKENIDEGKFKFKLFKKIKWDENCIWMWNVLNRNNIILSSILNIVMMHERYE